MSAPSLVILVTYCSNERAYIDKLLEGALHAADLVCVAVGRRLFDGREEDAEHIQTLAVQYPRARFVWFEVDPPDLLATPVVLHNRARTSARDLATLVLAGRGSSLAECWTILLDGDEVPCEGGKALREWWLANQTSLVPARTYKLSNSWFFLHPTLVSEQHEDSVVLVHGSHLTDRAMTHPRERDGVCFVVSESGGECTRAVMGLKGQPMFDHFSWVRASRDLLLAKVANWGHSKDSGRDWTGMVNHAYDEMEAGRLPKRDFVHGRRLLTVMAPFAF